MGTESKGRAWFGKIYNKLETILVEVDTFTSQSTLCLNSSDPPGWESVRCEPKEVAEDQSSGASNNQQDHDHVASSSCKSLSDPPSHQNFDISGNVRVEERVQWDDMEENLSPSSFPDGEILSSRASLLEEVYCDGNLTSPTTIWDDEESTDEESHITNTLAPQKTSAGEFSVSTDEEMEEEVRFESCRDVVSKESQSTRSSLESDGCDEDPVLAALGISMDDSNLNPIATKVPDVPVLDNVENMRTFDEDNQYDVINGKSDGEPSVSPDEVMKEDVKFESVRDVASTETQSTQSSLESVGTVLTSDEDPVLAAPGISMDDSNLNLITAKLTDIPVLDDVSSMRSSSEDNQDDVISGKSDVAPSDSNASDGMACQEDPSCVDNNALYAVRVRTKKLRSFKRKILDALNAKRRREKEYEQLAIWFGDADMGSDMVAGEDSEYIDSKTLQVHEPEESQWELL